LKLSKSVNHKLVKINEETVDFVGADGSKNVLRVGDSIDFEHTVDLFEDTTKTTLVEAYLKNGYKVLRV
jgi:hypothetical protein